MKEREPQHITDWGTSTPNNGTTQR